MAKIYMTHDGKEIPAKYVSKLDKNKDRISLKYYKKAKRLHDSLKLLKQELLAETDKLYDQMLRDENIRTGKKGNYTISSFDKSIKIEVNVQNRIEFDDRINAAQSLINEYISEKTKGTDRELTELINSAFRTNKGKLDTKRILGLFRLQINHPKWKRAMELIKESISTNNSRRYVRIWQKDKNGDYKNIDLNFSSL